MSHAIVQINIKKNLIMNTTWLFADKAIRMVLGLTVSVIMARYLGPEDLGKWNYAESFFGIFLILTTLGFDSVLVRELVRNSSRTKELLGTAIVLKLFGTITAILLSSLFIYLIRPADTTVQMINLILALSSIFQLFDIIDYWFRAQMQSKYTVISKNIAFIFSSCIKIAVLIFKGSIYIVAICSHIEFLVGSMLLLLFYTKHQDLSILNWKFNIKIVGQLMADCWPIILSSSAVFVQARIDQIIIGEMLGDAAVGQYSVALRLIEVLGFIPVVISTAYAPIITRSKMLGETQYLMALSSVYKLMFVLFLITAIPIYILSNKIVIVLYGSDYAEAGALLSLFAIRLFFTNFGVAKSLFITNENLFKYTLITSLVGAVSNIVLNYLLIPVLGVKGSLIATIISFTISIFVIDLFFKGKIRGNLKLMFKSIFSFWTFKLEDVKAGDKSDTN
ncbi:flippase [Paenibacillus cellulositrophicus]|uniref:flippase n=1 Tax=Paenibacillus cellulositrophicus TaxID=562959 RepID=UPI00203BEE43|nr:flippase [Paenibacillus cellulositrophicus]MCM2996624.1 flippase [Paenibacillus cellulositrophicus]